MLSSRASSADLFKLVESMDKDAVSKGCTTSYIAARERLLDAAHEKFLLETYKGH
jgi:hypothetical protein